MRDLGGVCNVPDIASRVSTAVYAGVCARYSLVWSFHTNLPTAGSPARTTFELSVILPQIVH